VAGAAPQASLLPPDQFGFDWIPVHHHCAWTSTLRCRPARTDRIFQYGIKVKCVADGRGDHVEALPERVVQPAFIAASDDPFRRSMGPAADCADALRTPRTASVPNVARPEKNAASKKCFERDGIWEDGGECSPPAGADLDDGCERDL
jgi:hypothetical protein